MKTTEVELVVTDGQVGQRAKDHAREMIASLERLAPRPLLHAQIKLSTDGSDGITSPAHAQATLDVNGTRVRAHVAASRHEEAIDLLADRLRTQLQRLSTRLESMRREPVTVPDGEWRHGALPASRPDFFPRPPEERELVRHKTFAPEAMQPDEAAFDLQLLDHDFYLFVDEASGRDAVIHRLADEGFGLMVDDGEAVVADDLAITLTLEPRPPRLVLDAAIERLEAGDEPFVFFVDPATDRGAVLYRRYDGHYGLITPRDEE